LREIATSDARGNGRTGQRNHAFDRIEVAGTTQSAEPSVEGGGVGCFVRVKARMGPTAEALRLLYSGSWVALQVVKARNRESNGPGV
jgi:hypothetical protein